MVAFYTFLMAILLLVFNVHDYVVAPEYLAWSRIVSFIFSIFLFFSAICLLAGLLKGSHSLLGVWVGIFSIYIVYQIAFVAWNIYYYTLATDQGVPANIRGSFLANIITFGILVFIDVFALVAVHSEREHMRGKGSAIIV